MLIFLDLVLFDVSNSVLTYQILKFALIGKYYDRKMFNLDNTTIEACLTIKYWKVYCVQTPITCKASIREVHIIQFGISKSNQWGYKQVLIAY